MLRTSSQNANLHRLLTSGNMLEQKHTLAASFSNGRTHNTSELTTDECQALIKYLQRYLKEFPQYDAAHKMRRKIIAIAHQLHWYLRDAQGNLMLWDGQPKLDYGAIDTWCEKYSPWHKGLNKHTSLELTTLVTQFEKVLQSHLNKQGHD